jgi:hypothetical protein
MPGIDDARRRLLLASHHADALGAVVMNRDIDDATTRQAQRELIESGILDNDHRLHPLAADLARTMMAPTFEFAIEHVGPQGASMSIVAVRNETVWSYDPWPDSGPGTEMVYSQEELPVLIWTLARLTGLRRVKPPDDAVSVTATLGLVDALMMVFQEAGAEQWSTVRTVALAKADEHAAHLDEAARKRWVAILGSLICFWRVTSRWADPHSDTGQRHKTLAVFDCGSEGYWQRTLEGGETTRLADVTPDTPVHLTPRTGGELWDALKELLPSGEELRAAYGRDT